MLKGLNEKELENVVSQMVSDMEEPQPGSAQEKGIIEIKGDITESNFQAFTKSENAEMLAVDGGSATILNAGSFVVAGVRVGHVIFHGKEFSGASEPDYHLLHLASGHLEKYYEIFFEKIVGGNPPDYPKGLEEAVGRIRALMEWNQVEKIQSQDIPEGAVLAFDGAMWAGIKGVGDLLERIVEQAKQKKIILCGISKKSMLVHNSRPLIPAVQMLGDDSLPGATWHYPLDTGNYAEKLFGKIYLAKLHPRSRYVFRVDLSLPGGVEPEQAFGKLAYYADDPTYVGYPYPLARVHNDVAFSRAEVSDLKAMLRAAALQKGMNPKEWQLTFQDFHEILDTGR
ncbi:MAG: DNA double-strand break repair nuclease NurA [Thermoplasmata archaeon]|nr:DNA double-strand break repair nuclease NurA [Thermoplasmata archaeon]